MEQTKQYSTMLTIAGSDSIGGAGIQADIKTCCAMGVYAMSVITAVTAQNTRGVASFAAISRELVRQQLHEVLTDVRPDAVKIGMLPNAECIEEVANALTENKITNIVLDPVMVATSGDRLNDNQTLTIEAMTGLLFPIADVVTPNIPEAEFLTGLTIENEEKRIESAEKIIIKYGAKAVLLKGGHINSGVAEDILVGYGEIRKFVSPIIETVNTHGTGCSLSSAIASGLGLGLNLGDAIKEAKKFIATAIYEGSKYKFGNGHGPINHLYKIQQYDRNDK